MQTYSISLHKIGAHTYIPRKLPRYFYFAVFMLVSQISYLYQNRIYAYVNDIVTAFFAMLLLLKFISKKIALDKSLTLALLIPLLIYVGNIYSGNLITEGLRSFTVMVFLILMIYDSIHENNFSALAKGSKLSMMLLITANFITVLLSPLGF